MSSVVVLLALTDMLILHLIIIFRGNITAKAYDQTDETNNATSDPRHVTDTTPPRNQ